MCFHLTFSEGFHSWLDCCRFFEISRTINIKTVQIYVFYQINNFYSIEFHGRNVELGKKIHNWFRLYPYGFFGKFIVIITIEINYELLKIEGSWKIYWRCGLYNIWVNTWLNQNYLWADVHNLLYNWAKYLMEEYYWIKYDPMLSRKNTPK